MSYTELTIEERATIHVAQYQQLSQREMIVDLATIGQRERREVVQWIIVVTQRALWRGFFDEATEDVVFKRQSLGIDSDLAADISGRALDFQQPVHYVVFVLQPCITVGLGHEPPNFIPLELGEPFYTGVEKCEEHENREVLWQIAARHSKYSKLKITAACSTRSSA